MKTIAKPDHPLQVFLQWGRVLRTKNLTMITTGLSHSGYTTSHKVDTYVSSVLTAVLAPCTISDFQCLKAGWQEPSRSALVLLTLWLLLFLFCKCHIKEKETDPSPGLEAGGGIQWRCYNLSSRLSHRINLKWGQSVQKKAWKSSFFFFFFRCVVAWY